MTDVHGHTRREPGLTRRAAIRELGRAGLAVVVFGACSDGSNGGPPASTGAPPPEPASTILASSSTLPTTTAAPSEPVAATTSSGPVASASLLPVGTQWDAIAMPNTTAYVLYRDGEATLVDTGLPGSVVDFEQVFAELGIRWADVGDIVVTHHHLDHAGGIGDLSALAPGATVHIGSLDAASVGAFPDGFLASVDDGDQIADLRVIATPGHTAGHISVLHEQAGILVAGDAVNNIVELKSASADTQFTIDGAEADRSVRKLAGFDYDVLLMGHGDPITRDASSAVDDLATRLGV